MIYFPCAISAASVTCELKRPIGAVKTVLVVIRYPIDRTPWDDAPDAGSKPWLVAQAMNSDTVELDAGNAALYQNLVARKKAEEEQEDTFHKRGYQVTHKSAESDDEELPEDRFHKKDAMSSYLLQQRADESKEKRERHEKYVELFFNNTK